MSKETPPDAADVQHHYAGIFLVTDGGLVIGQRRDSIPTIDNPGKVGAFGGTVEPSEDPRYAAWREVTQEETNLRLDLGAIQPLMQDVAWRQLTSEWEVRHFFYARITRAQLEQIEVYEGAGWAAIPDPGYPDLIDSWREPVARLLEVLRDCDSGSAFE